MFDKREPLDFLKRMTFFKRAAKTGSTDPYADLMAKYNTAQDDQNQATNLAQKLSAYYGMAGLYLYIPLKLQALQTAKTVEHEIIGQDLIQLLSLILYMESYAGNDAEKTWVSTQKETCQKLCNASEKEEVMNEAKDLADYYRSLSPN